MIQVEPCSIQQEMIRVFLFQRHLCEERDYDVLAAHWAEVRVMKP